CATTDYGNFDYW
nr:immunoglobulin heavy chain junction region [Macaca mulatta]